MSMEYIRKRYSVPAKRGARVRYTGSPGNVYDGSIVGSRGAHLRIRFDDKPMGADIVDAHPTWKIEYLEEAS